MKRPRRLKAAIVHWRDAYECENHEPAADGLLQVSAGILVAKNRKCIKLAKIADAYHDEGDPWRDVLTIPASLVVAIEIVPVRPPPEAIAAPRRSRNPPPVPPAPPPVDA